MFGFEQVAEMLDDGQTHRKQFSAHTGVQKNKGAPTFSVPFDNGLCQHFLDGTGRRLTFNAQHNQHYCFIRTPEAILEVEEWERHQGSLVFIRNLLSSTTALDSNFADIATGQKTNFGSAEEMAKYRADERSINILTQSLAGTVSQISYLRGCDFICAVPASAEKEFDLPRLLAEGVSGAVGKPDVSSILVAPNKKAKVKDASRDERWGIWEAAEVKVLATPFSGRDVLLLDDKYQSGISMHFIANKLLEAGARAVHGLVAVKTVRDSDNLALVEDD